MNHKILKMSGLIGMVLSFAATLFSDYAKDQKMKDEIDKKVDEKFDQYMKEKEGS